MANIKKNKDKDFDVEIGLDQNNKWSEDKLAKIHALIKEKSNNRSPEQRLKNEILGIRYQMEEYLEQKNITSNDLFTIDHFLDAYLKVLNINFKTFAVSIDTTD